MLNMAWFAGFFDGDGSVGVYRDRYKDARSPNTEAPRYVLRASVCNQSKWLLEGFVALWGGSISKQPRAWLWRISAAKAQWFLEDIYPHVVNKRDQVALALEYRGRMYRPYPGCSSDELYNDIVSNKLKAMKREHRPPHYAPLADSPYTYSY